MIVTKKALSRRTVLKGFGAALSLPFLDAMVPAFAKSAFANGAPVRLAWFYIPNGVDMRYWTPGAEGALGELPSLLAPMDPVKRDITVLSNLTTHWGRALQDGPGDHGRALGSYMTGVKVFKTAGADLKLGISADQAAANVNGHLTRLPSLEVGLEEARIAGNCDSGYSCAYVYNLAWKTESQPLPPISDPRLLFERLFGADVIEPAAARAKRLQMRQSILDGVMDETQKLQNTLGGTDRRKMDEYLTSVREIELQVQRAAKEGVVLDPGIEKPFGVPAEFQDYFRLMSDMLLIAFKADVTRISTFLMAREGSVRAYPEIGVNDGHHPLTHHMGNMDMLAKVRQINELHSKLFAEFLLKLKNTPEGDSNLLDQSLICYGSGIADGNAHTHDQLPTILAGRGGGFVTPGRHIVYQRETPVTNLFATMIERVGVRAEHVGDSTGSLDGLSLS
jgi:hypothetical protein